MINYPSTNFVVVSNVGIRRVDCILLLIHLINLITVIISLYYKLFYFCGVRISRFTSSVMALLYVGGSFFNHLQISASCLA